MVPETGNGDRGGSGMDIQGTLAASTTATAAASVTEQPGHRRPDLGRGADAAGRGPVDGAGGGWRPLIVGMGGTTRPDSSTHRALAATLRLAEAAGAETVLLGSADLDLPIYAPERPERSPAALRLLAEVGRADGVVIATPGYHGGVSGLVKNALDYLEDLRESPRPYLDGRAVGLVVCAHGPQAGGSTLSSLRSIVHALRGWPTPLGVMINSSEPLLDAGGAVRDPETEARLCLLADQVVGFARAWSRRA
jgi:FMN reductase